MIDSPYLDWAIALAVIFFMGGLVVSGLNELISWCTRVRAKFLWAYLHDLLGPRDQRALPGGLLGVTRLWGTALAGRHRDKRPTVEQDVPQAGANKPQELLHRLARALDPINTTQFSGKRTALAHIPPASLAQALLEVFADVGRAGVQEPVGVLLDANATAEDVTRAAEKLKRQLDLDADPHPQVVAFRATPADATADALAEILQPGDSAVRDALRGAAAALQAGSAPGEADAIVDAILRARPSLSERARVEHALGQLVPTAPLTKTLKRLWAAAEGEIDVFRTDIERYLDAEMQRLSEYYRRSIKFVTAVLAALVALIGGLDAIELGQNVWSNPGTRAALVQQADALASESADAEDPDSILQALRTRCGAGAAPATPAEPFDTKLEADAAFAKARDCVNDSIDELTGTNALSNAAWSDWSGWKHEWTSRFWPHLLGTLLAAIALWLGAPFWFDVIKRLTGLRKPAARDA